MTRDEIVARALRDSRRLLAWSTIIAILFTAGAVLYGQRAGRAAAELRATGVQTTGTVVYRAARVKSSDWIQIAFDADRRRFVDVNVKYAGSYRRNQQLRVYYDAADPKRIAIDGEVNRGAGAGLVLALLIVTAGLATLAVLVASWSLLAARQEWREKLLAIMPFTWVEPHGASAATLIVFDEPSELPPKDRALAIESTWALRQGRTGERSSAVFVMDGDAPTHIVIGAAPYKLRPVTDANAARIAYELPSPN